MPRTAKKGKPRVESAVVIVRTFARPGTVVEREELYKSLVDLVVGLTGQTERYACLLATGGEIVVRLSDSEYEARHG